MTQPKIGVSMLYTLGKSFSNMVQSIATLGTSYVEIIDDGFHALNKSRVQTLKQVAKSQDLKYTLHAPFADINIASPSKTMLKASLKRLEKSMVFANALNAEVWVFHPGMKTGISMFYPGQDWIQNVRSIQLISKLAEKYNLQIALENVPEPFAFIMKTVRHFTNFYAETGLDLGLVLDVGHAHISNEISLFLKAFKDKIVHIHVSDNVGEIDQHLGIGYGKINWQEFSESLKRISYSRTVMVESVEHVEESLKKLKSLFA